MEENERQDEQPTGETTTSSSTPSTRWPEGQPTTSNQGDGASDEPKTESTDTPEGAAV